MGFAVGQVRLFFTEYIYGLQVGQAGATSSGDFGPLFSDSLLGWFTPFAWSAILPANRRTLGLLANLQSDSTCVVSISGEGQASGKDRWESACVMIKEP